MHLSSVLNVYTFNVIIGASKWVRELQIKYLSLILTSKLTINQKLGAYRSDNLVASDNKECKFA